VVMCKRISHPPERPICPYPLGSELPLCTSKESSFSEPQLCVSSSAAVRERMLLLDTAECTQCVMTANQAWGSVLTCWLLEHPLHLHTITMRCMMGCGYQVHKQRLGS
jgi:hypothetical protein